MVADLGTPAPADVPVAQRILFAAIGWVPAVALVLAMVAAFGPATPAPGPVEEGGRVAPALLVTPAAPAAKVVAPPRPVTRTLLSGGGTGNYTGPPVTAAADVRMVVTYRVTCRSRLPYFTVSWEGAGPDFDYLTVTGALRMFGTGHLDPASTTGRFEVRTRDDCTWTVLISQRS